VDVEDSHRSHWWSGTPILHIHIPHRRLDGRRSRRRSSISSSPDPSIATGPDADDDPSRGVRLDRTHRRPDRWLPPSRSPPRSALAPRPPRADRPRSPRARPRRPPSRVRSWCVHIDSTRRDVPDRARVANGWIESNLAGSIVRSTIRDVDVKGIRARARTVGNRRVEILPWDARGVHGRVWRRARVIVGGCAHRGPSRVTRALSALSGARRVRGRARVLRARRDG